MENNSNLILTHTDFQKLASLVTNVESDVAELLEEELSRASIVDQEQLPNDVVSMNSKVSFVDLDTNHESTVTLVFPHAANIDENKISILAPIGAALIGLRVGQDIHWPLPNGKEKKLKVVSVIYQPESASV